MSNSEVEKCPTKKIPEYPFIGRSNVGKSSLINMICSDKKLAKTSNKPGKTKLINHFIIDKSWFLVDLPGYGYAKASKSNKKIITKIINDYFKKRKQIISAFVLVDIRHETQEIDLNFMRWLNNNYIPFSIILTKADKLTKKKVLENKKKYLNAILKEWENSPQIFITSSQKKIGREKILKYISTLNSSFKI